MGDILTQHKDYRDSGHILLQVSGKDHHPLVDILEKVTKVLSTVGQDKDLVALENVWETQVEDHPVQNHYRNRDDRRDRKVQELLLNQAVQKPRDQAFTQVPYRRYGTTARSWYVASNGRLPGKQWIPQ